MDLLEVQKILGHHSILTITPELGPQQADAGDQGGTTHNREPDNNLALPVGPITDQ